MKKNIKKLNISLFRFNYKTDYLPHYKKYSIDFDLTKTIYDLLEHINQKDSFSYEDMDKCCLKVNNYFLKVNILLKDIVEKCGDELVLEPLSIYRATNDLIIDTKDYIEKLNLLNNYITDDEKKEYLDKYKLEYYASNTLNFNKEYIGNHIFLLVYDLIKKDSGLKKELLEIISQKDSGMLYYTSLSNRLFVENNDIEKKYEELRQMIDINFTNHKEESSIEEEPLNIEQYFENFNISVYQGKDNHSLESIINKSKAKYVVIDSVFYDLALDSQKVDKNFSLKIAGEILLESKDSNADFLIVNDLKFLEIFDTKQKKIEKLVGRDINLPVISKKQFYQLLAGEKSIEKLGFDKHKVKATFIDY